ncbi:DUF6257 family protein [Streptomyces sp.]|uniref:DUF6257 family protein n=1 Tax=Streptomyces sp. TaxID=1931 RepID=UPI00281137FF|nr:DUF6257 family protein [Streptomyces sp.]
MSSNKIRLTAGEKAQIAWYVARMAKRGLADDRHGSGRVDQSDLRRKIERIENRALKRQQGSK